MLQRYRETLALVLIGYLPFHALLVTLGTKLLVGPGHAPLAILALWKELVLGILLVLAIVEIVKLIIDQPPSSRRPALSRKERGYGRQARLRPAGNGQWTIIHPDILDWLIIGLIALSVLVSIFNYPFSIIQYVYGVKYDFIPLIAFLVLRRVGWSDAFKENAVNLLLLVGMLVAAFGFVSFFLPSSFFTVLGYSDLHSLYLPDQPLAAFQQIGSSSIRRIQSTMSGPNQLGLWLLLPLSVWLNFRSDGTNRGHISYAVTGGMIGIAILLTFSRSAWIAAAVIVLLAMHKQLAAHQFRVVFYPLFTITCIAVITSFSFLPGMLYRAASTLDHLIKPMEAAQIITENPLGLGLGSAGPASNRTSDACVHLQPLDDPSWAADRPDLCVFLGSQQVQPKNRVCNCPLLPENWYLQMGVELGIVGFALFAGLVLLVLRRLRGENTIFLAFLGISIAALFLHAWESAAVAYTVWMLSAIHLSRDSTLL